MAAIKLAMQGGTQRYRAGATIVALGRGYFQDQDIDVQITAEGGRREVVPLLADEQVDVCLQGPSLEFFKSWNPSRPYIMAADHGSNPAPVEGKAGGGLVARTELVTSGRLRDYADLRGLRLGLSPIRGDHDWQSFEEALRRGGLTFDDVEVVISDFGSGRHEALAKGTTDVTNVGRLRSVLEGQREGTFVVWKQSAELNAGHQSHTVVFSYPFWSERPDEAKAYLRAHLRAAREYHNAFVHDVDRRGVIELLARESGYTPEELDRDMIPYAMNPDGYINVESIGERARWLEEQGALAGPLDLDRLVDHSHLEAALTDVGRYQPPR